MFIDQNFQLEVADLKNQEESKYHMLKKLKTSNTLNFLLKNKPLYSWVKKCSFHKWVVLTKYIVQNNKFNKFYLLLLLFNLVDNIYFNFELNIYYHYFYKINLNNSNFYKKKFKFQLIFFYKNWEIFDYYYIPTLLKFNNNFLNSKFFLKKIKTIFTEFYNFSFSKTLHSTNICRKFSTLSLAFKKNNLKIKYLLDLIISFNWDDPYFTIFKNFILNEENIKIFRNSYQSYWAFINTSLYLTWSFLNQLQITSSGLDIWMLQNFNTIFFWLGDIYSYPIIWEWFVWDFRNFLTVKSIPYTSTTWQINRNNFLLMPAYDFDFDQTNNVANKFKIKKYNSWFYNEVVIFYFK